MTAVEPCTHGCHASGAWYCDKCLPNHGAPGTRQLLFSFEQAAEILGGVVTARWLYDQARNNLIAHTHIGKWRGMSEADIRALIEGGHVEPTPVAPVPDVRFSNPRRSAVAR